MVFAAATAAGLAAIRRQHQPTLVTLARTPKSTGTRPHVITVFRPMDEVRRDGKLPSPLAELGDSVTVEIRPAPADRGTEIVVRSISADPGQIRRALRDTRSLLEVGDVLLPDGPPTTKPTLLNKPLRAVTQHGREGGLL
jgi:hypothetical protein